MTKVLMISILLISLALAGCAGMSDTGQRTLSGGALGAAGGAIIGAISGSVGLGAAIGGAVGAGGGYLYGKHKESKQESYQQGYKAGQQSQYPPCGAWRKIPPKIAMIIVGPGRGRGRRKSLRSMPFTMHVWRYLK